MFLHLIPCFGFLGKKLQVLLEYLPTWLKLESNKYRVRPLLILLFSEMLKFSKIIFSKSKNIVKYNGEYLGIFHFLKLIFQN